MRLNPAVRQARDLSLSVRAAPAPLLHPVSPASTHSNHHQPSPFLTEQFQLSLKRECSSMSPMTQVMESSEETPPSATPSVRQILVSELERPPSVRPAIAGPNLKSLRALNDLTKLDTAEQGVEDITSAGCATRQHEGLVDSCGAGQKVGFKQPVASARLQTAAVFPGDENGLANNASPFRAASMRMSRSESVSARSSTPVSGSTIQRHAMGAMLTRGAQLSTPEQHAGWTGDRTRSGSTGTMALPREEPAEADRGVPVAVMLPLDTVNSDGVFRYASSRWFTRALQHVACTGVRAVAVDVWWGAVERSPRKYDWSGYKQLFEVVKAAGLKLQCVMSFHACGGNVGDLAQVPLPKWVLKCGEADPDLFFTDKPRETSLGQRNKEYISIFADEVPGCLRGRSPLQCYADFMRAFRDAFIEDIGDTIEEVVVGSGPCGELRYPSYVEANGWRFPGVGEFQCYDRRALASLAQAAHAAGHPEWGNSGPHNAGQYNSTPEETGFFCSWGGSWDSPYGRFFLEWYAAALAEHCERLLRAAAAIFNTKNPQRCTLASGPLGNSEPGLGSSGGGGTMVVGGPFGADQRAGSADLLAPPGVRVASSPNGGGPMGELPEEAVYNAGDPRSVLANGVEIPIPAMYNRGPDAGPSLPYPMADMMRGANGGAFAERSLSVMSTGSSSGSESLPDSSLGDGADTDGADRTPGGSASAVSAPSSARGSGRPRTASALSLFSSEGGDGGPLVGYPENGTVEPDAPRGKMVDVSIKIAGIHWWYRTRSHAAELTAGYFNCDGRPGYQRIIDLCALYGASLTLTCVEMCDMQHPPEALCGPEGLLRQVREGCACAGVPLAGENALPCFAPNGVDTVALDRIVYNTQAWDPPLQEESKLAQAANGALPPTSNLSSSPDSPPAESNGSPSSSPGSSFRQDPRYAAASQGCERGPLPVMRGFTFLRLTPEMVAPAYHDAWLRFMHKMSRRPPPPARSQSMSDMGRGPSSW